MPHPNDATHWPEIACQRGHEAHMRRDVLVRLGANDSYWDYPRIPKRFRDDFHMQVWNWLQYNEDGPYCPGHDVVSQTIDTLGVWEQCETAVMLMVFERVGQGGWFIDFGCQVGWYSVLAARMGLDVYAIDADPECVSIASHNIDLAAHHGGGHSITTQQRASAASAPIPELRNFSGSRQPIAVKIDVEGAEEHALAMLSENIDDVDYALIEISPVFNDSYPALVQSMLDRGFEAYEVPPRGDPPVQVDQLSDLHAFRIADPVAAAGPELHQANWLFARGGL